MTISQLNIGKNSYTIASDELPDSSDLEEFLKAQILYPVDVDGGEMSGLEFGVKFYTGNHNLRTLELTPSAEVTSYRLKAEAKTGFSDKFSLKSADFSPRKSDIEILLQVKSTTERVTERVRYIYFFFPTS